MTQGYNLIFQQVNPTAISALH